MIETLVVFWVAAVWGAFFVCIPKVLRSRFRYKLWRLRDGLVMSQLRGEHPPGSRTDKHSHWGD